jgi:hypothetical protein
MRFVVDVLPYPRFVAAGPRSGIYQGAATPPIKEKVVS